MITDDEKPRRSFEVITQILSFCKQRVIESRQKREKPKEKEKPKERAKPKEKGKAKEREK